MHGAVPEYRWSNSGSGAARLWSSQAGIGATSVRSWSKQTRDCTVIGRRRRKSGRTRPTPVQTWPTSAKVGQTQSINSGPLWPKFIDVWLTPGPRTGLPRPEFGRIRTIEIGPNLVEVGTNRAEVRVTLAEHVLYLAKFGLTWGEFSLELAEHKPHLADPSGQRSATCGPPSFRKDFCATSAEIAMYRKCIGCER